MCGFTGIIGRQFPESDAIIAMTRAIAHRGPDGEGFHRGNGVAFGHRRLSIIDVDHGQQPMTAGDDDDSARWTLVFNGEIYNHESLREELERKGARFTTRCDTEVVLQGFIMWGAAVTDRLRGMFSFAIWDAREHTCFVARDHMGVKPLYWTKHDERVLIGSEIKALLADSTVPRTPNIEGLEAYMSGLMFPGALTAFKGIHELPAGHRMWIRWNPVTSQVHTEVERYFQISFDPNPDFAKASLEDLIEPVRAAAARVVDMRRMSDVPIGIFLSGGVDSSLVAALLASTHSDPVRSFSLLHDGENAEISEKPYIDVVVEQYGLHHQTLTSDPAWLGCLPQLVGAFDQPCTTALNSYFLAQRAAQDVKVVLTGTGGDEGFAGYGRYLLATGQSGLSDDELRRDFTERVSSGRTKERDGLYGDRLRPYVNGGFWQRAVHEHFDRADLPGRLARCLHVDQMLYLIDNLHNNLDKVTMAHSLEARVPLCDPDFLAFANSLPAAAKMAGDEPKALLKAVAATVLSPEIIYRRKRGFGIPIGNWIRGAHGKQLIDILDRRRIKSRGLFRWKDVKRMIDHTMSGRANYAQRLWMIASVEVWFSMYIDGHKAAPVRSAARVR